MPFTADELANISAAALDFHLKGPVHAQTLQEKPMLRLIKAKQKTFPSGKEYITQRVKGVYSTTIQGFTGDDSVTYGNPANTKTAIFPWKELHAGIQVTMTELKKDGISVVDTNGENVTEHDGREATALANLLDEKMEDMSEGWARSFNLMAWRDGTQDSKFFPGLKSFVHDDPTIAVSVAGIDQGVHTWWRNRANLSVTHTTASDQAAVQTMQNEFRQLRRYGAKPNFALCGSDWLDWLEKELRSKGNYTLDGWAKTGKIDASVADIVFKGVEFEYDPTLDDEGEADRCYIGDSRLMTLRPMEGEDMKQHNPSRPEDKYVIFRAMTWTGGFTVMQRNGFGVYKLA